MTRTPVLSAEEAALYAIAVGSGVTTAALNAPPGSPSEGDTYIVGPSPTGAWAGKANRVAVYDAAAWAFIPASTSIGTSHRNLALGNKASAVSYRWTGAAWRTLAAPTTMLQFSDSFDPHPQYVMRGEATAAVAWGDVTGKPSTFAPSAHTHPQSEITNLTTDLAGKQATLVSTTNIKSINGSSILGSGDLTVSGSGAAWGGITGTLSSQTDLQTALNGKANSLGTDDNYVTDAEKVVIGNTSGTNTGDETAAGILSKLLTVDGAGSGLDADLLDGNSSAAFATASHTHAQSDITNLVSDLAGKQPLDADLTTIAGLTATSDNFMQAKAGAWASRTVAQVKTDLGLTGTNSGDQTTIAGITGTKAQFDTACTDGNFLYVGDVTSNATHTGDVTGATALTIANSAVTLAKMADMATASVIYRKTAGTGAPEVNTLATLKTDLGLTGTNSGDNAVNSLYSGLVSNATHTGDVTGSTALTLANAAITGKTLVTAVGTDYVLISDTSDSGNLKKALASDLTGSGGSVAWGSITGTLSGQTDLQTALDAKQDKFPIIYLDANYTLTSQTALQKAFSVTGATGGAYTVVTGKKYRFRGLIELASLSTTSGTISLGFLGTAILAHIRWQSQAAKTTTSQGSDNVTRGVVATATVVTAASTTATGFIEFRGTIDVTTGGTFIPAVGMSVAAAAVVQRGSYFEIEEFTSPFQGAFT